MMSWLGKQLGKRLVAWAVVAVVLLACALLGAKAMTVDQDDDLLAFLPRDNPDVARFHEINEAFGGLSVAIVGIEVSDPFDAAFLGKLKSLTDELNDEPSIGHALSLANVEDFRLDPERGGMVADYLVSELPDGPEAKAALRERVMSKDHIVENLIAADGKAVILYGFFAHGADPRATATLMREKVEAALGDHPLYWGGAPFISTYIYDLTLADMKRLIPWAVVLIIFIIVLSFRDAVGAALALVSTSAGIVVAYGLMGLFGVDANIVLSSMPVILFAVGSAYAIHILVRYYALRAEREAAEAMRLTLVQVGPTVIAAGLTTVAGLLSFLAMDIEPMRQFGLFTGIGIFAALLLSITFVPAVVVLLGLKRRELGDSVFRRALVELSRVARARRVWLGGVLAALAVAGAALAWRVEARMENAAFFAEDSPPDRAEEFLRSQFGGSQFIQVLVEGDMTDPGVLREVQRLADSLLVREHVTSVTHVGSVLALVNEAMVSERRVPNTRAQVQLLYRFLAGRAAIKQLVSEDHKQALLHIKVDTDRHEVVGGVLAEVERFTREEAIARYRVVGEGDPGAQEDKGHDGASTAATDKPAAHAPSDDQAAVRARRKAVVEARLAALAHEYGTGMDRAALDSALDRPATAGDPAKVREQLVTFLRSDESLLEEEQHAAAPAIADAVVALGAQPTDSALLGAVEGALIKRTPECRQSEKAGDDEVSEACRQEAERNEQLEELAADLATSLATPVKEAWRQVGSRGRAEALARAAAMRLPEGPAAERLLTGIADALLDLDGERAIVPAHGEADGELTYVVNGQPVLYRGLAKSVTANQFKSLASALGLVLIILMILFRSPLSGALATLPTAITLLAIYGAMGARGLHLDIGTSMLASIIVGAGVDYAVHLMAAWRAEPGEQLDAAAERAARHAGPAIWINAVMVAAGFFVLTLGEAKPLKNVGGLTASAMIVAALATFVAIPVLARKRRYTRG